MDPVPLPWLDAFAHTVVRGALLLLVVVNGAFAATVALTRSRAVVNRWTKPVLMADAALLVALVGAPVGAIAGQLAAKAVGWAAAQPAAVVTPEAK